MPRQCIHPQLLPYYTCRNWHMLLHFSRSTSGFENYFKPLVAHLQFIVASGPWFQGIDTQNTWSGSQGECWNTSRVVSRGLENRARNGLRGFNLKGFIILSIAKGSYSVYCKLILLCLSPDNFIRLCWTPPPNERWIQNLFPQIKYRLRRVSFKIFSPSVLNLNPWLVFMNSKAYHFFV